MAALGTISLTPNPTPVTIAAYGASTSGIGSGSIGLKANPSQLVEGAYSIAGTKQQTRTVPTWGQLYPRGDNNW